MLFIHLMILVIHGFNVGTSGLIWKRNSVQHWETVTGHKVPDKQNTQPTRDKDLSSAATGNVQYQQEEQLANGTVVGKYGILEPSGKLRLVSYTADKDGFRPKQESATRFDYVAEDTLKNVNPKDLKLHNQLADFNSIKAAIAPSGGSKSFEYASPNEAVPEKFFDIQGYASSYRPYSSCCGTVGVAGNVYHSKYYPDYYPGNTYYTPSTSSGSFYPESRGYGASYPGYVYNSYGPTLPTKYHHTSQLYPPTVEPPPIPNYYPLYDVPTPRIPTVSSYPCCSG